MRMLLRLAAALLFASASAYAQDKQDVMDARPAMWTVHSAAGTAYLLGSLHLLPGHVHWRTPAIDAAMKNSDVFVFEAPLDQRATKQIQNFVRAHGNLPSGVTLTSLLSSAQRKDLKTALKISGVPLSSIDDKQPWLAALVLDVASAFHNRYSLDSGVDRRVYAYAMGHKRRIETLETIPEQLALLDPGDQKLEIKEFDSDMRQIVAEPDTLEKLLSAWEKGDAASVAAIMNAEIAKDPGAADALLYNRNVKWAAQLKAMLKHHETFFITVGAGHLVGTKSLPDLMRKAGYKVDGP